MSRSEQKIGRIWGPVLMKLAVDWQTEWEDDVVESQNRCVTVSIAKKNRIFFINIVKKSVRDAEQVELRCY